MKVQARRNFIKSCLYAAVSGLGLSIFFPSTVTGNRRIQGSPNRTAASSSEPSYLELHRSGELQKRGGALWQIMENCKLCPRMCGVNKLKGNKGYCGAGSQLMISSFHPHFGEERPLVGRGGSGTIFMTHCGLRCVFCCNWEISQGGRGVKHTLGEMAEMRTRGIMIMIPANPHFKHGRLMTLTFQLLKTSHSTLKL